MAENNNNKIDIWDVLRKRFPENEYALMAEVRDSAGHYASRSADYIAVNLWPSRGLTVTGIELKSFRSDWLTELKKPKKAEAIFQYCDYFWLLTTDDTIAKLEEIPETWGWMFITKGGRIKIMKPAPKLTPVPITRHFFAASLKRAADKTNFVHLDSIAEKIEEITTKAKTDAEYAHKHTIDELNKLQIIVREFSKASGIDLQHHYRWRTNPGKMGNAVKFLEEGGVVGIKKDLLRLGDSAKTILEQLAAGLKLIEELEIKESQLPEVTNPE